MKLVLVDFDGTITTKEIYTRFILTATHPLRLVIAGLLISPAIALYKSGLLPANKMRPLVARAAFAGVSEKNIAEKATSFVDDYVPTVLRPEMIDTIRRHQKAGDRVVVVSASLSPYLNIWCERMGIEVLCSDLVVKRGRFTGGYRYGDCSLENKVAAVKRHIDLESFSHITAYGDTREDFAMLNMAHTGVYRGQPYNRVSDD